MQAELPAAAEVAEALARVYARPELAPRPPGRLDPLWEAIRGFWRRVGELLGGLGDLRADTPWLYWTILVLLAAAGASIVVYFLYQVLSRLGEAAPRSRGEPGEAPVRGARARTAAGWEDLAARLAAAGRHREAALALYQGVLLRLEAAGALRYDPAKTPGDYRRETRPHPRGGALAAFLRGFEPVAFGGRTIGAEGFERLRSAAAEAAPGG